MGKKAGLSSANSQEQVKARVSRVKQAPAHDWLARVAMKFEVLEGLYPDSRKAGSNNFDLTPFSIGPLQLVLDRAHRCALVQHLALARAHGHVPVGFDVLGLCSLSYALVTLWLRVWR